MALSTEWLDDGRTRYMSEAGANDRYMANHPILNVATKPFRLADNVVFGFSSTLLRAGVGIVSSVSHPELAAKAGIDGLDGILRHDSNLDGIPDTPLSVRWNHSSWRERAMGLGEVGANIFMILVPEAKIGALRATSYGGKLATATKIGDGILVGERGVLATSKFVPNPYGKLGGPAHQALVADITADIKLRGLVPEGEFRIPTPGGAKSARFVDVVAINPATELPVEYYQVGKQTLAGNPISREVRAIRDIQQETKQPITFKPYNLLGN
jgi:hypothetical protein